ncbi:MAG: acetolactate synthase large subunit [Proteobacteria bacterium]|nr:acetolactate synthase large subunit [Pseudomonadota bacterium]
MKTSDLFIKALENEGVEAIYGVPGEENLDLVESIRKSSIKLVITRHEQVAGFMAATYGRLTGKTGVCLSTLGPGATNLVTAAAYAQLGGMPMMMITGQKPIKKSKQGKFQIVDIVEMMRPLTKLTKQIVYGSTVPALVRESFRLAEEERPGAVHLELPEDIAAEDAEGFLFKTNMPVIPYADTPQLDEAVRMIELAKKPLLLIGAGANRKSTTKALSTFVDTIGIPFFNTQMGKGVVDERNPLFIGTAALSDGDFVHCAIHSADLIINVGHDIAEKPPFFMNRDGAKVIHVNFFPAHIDEVYFPNLELVGDISHTVDYFTQHIKKSSNWDLAYFHKVKNIVDQQLLDRVSEDHFPLYPQRIVHDVRQVMPSDGILTLDNGMYKIWFARNYYAHQPNSILLDNALATMGAGLPSGMAAKLVHPNRKVLAICGDGGFMMNCHDLETAVRLKLDLVILVLHDSAYGMIKWKQANMKFTDFGLDFTDPDFVKFAESFGAIGHRVTKASEFSVLLKQALEKPGVHLIDVPIDYSKNVFDLGDGLKKQTCQL